MDGGLTTLSCSQTYDVDKRIIHKNTRDWRIQLANFMLDGNVVYF